MSARHGSSRTNQHAKYTNSAAQKHHPRVPPRRTGLLLVEGLDLFNLVPAAHEDTRPVVDVLRDHLEHPVHLAVDGLATGCALIMLASRTTSPG